MAITAENLAEKFGISREDVDKYSLDSHAKASSAAKANLFNGMLEYA
jgi:acetyl-CoA C-acetyltransferase